MVRWFFHNHKRYRQPIKQIGEIAILYCYPLENGVSYLTDVHAKGAGYSIEYHTRPFQKE